MNKNSRHQLFRIRDRRILFTEVATVDPEWIPRSLSLPPTPLIIIFSIDPPNRSYQLANMNLGLFSVEPIVYNPDAIQHRSSRLFFGLTAARKGRWLSGWLLLDWHACISAKSSTLKPLRSSNWGLRRKQKRIVLQLGYNQRDVDSAEFEIEISRLIKTIKG